MKFLVKSIRKITIRLRMILAFICLFALTLVIGLAGVTSLNKISSRGLENVTHLATFNEIYDLFGVIDICVYNLTNTTNDVVMQTVKKSLDEAIVELNSTRDEYLLNLDRDGTMFSPGEKQDIRNLFLIYEKEYLPLVEEVTALALQNKNEEAHQMALLEGDFYYSALSNITAMGFDKNMSGTYDSAVYSKESATTSVVEIVVGLVIAFAFAGLIGFVITASIARPMRDLRATAKKVSKGNFNVQIDTSGNDGITDLSVQFQTLISTFNMLTTDMFDVATKQENGDWSAFLQGEKFDGDYKKMADVFNSMCKSQIETTNLAVNCIKEIGAGNFNANIAQLPGDKKVYNDLIDSLSTNLGDVSTKINILISSAQRGKLKTRVSTDGMFGGWATIIKSLNTLLEVIDEPFTEYSRVLEEMAKGNLNVCVNGKYEGDFKAIQDNLNNTINELSSYVNEISSVLSEIANDNLTRSIEREYMGDFFIIRQSINDIFIKLNEVFYDIRNSAEEVNEGAAVISEGAMRIAGGSSAQSASVEELTSALILINESAKANDKNSTSATALSLDTMSNAESGNEQMSLLLVAMVDIKNASDNIHKIINVIEDIATQTNLLAINAAIEAARAGVHGRGFAIVAEQVRELANKSKVAAGQSSEFIEDTISKVEIGSKLSQITAQSLDVIVKNIINVSEIIEKISKASQEQVSSIDQVTAGLSQISEVVIANTSQSEEAAASSQELLSQAEILKNMVSKFELCENCVR